MMSRFHTALLLIGVLGCGTPKTDYPITAPMVGESSTLGGGDRIDVRVFYGAEQLSHEYTIGSNGNISLPFIGEVMASGKTQAELEKEIQVRLGDGYLVNPVVSVDVKETNSKKVSLFGEISRPGTQRYFEGMTIIDAVSQAGGFTPLARKNDVSVTRVVGTEKKKFVVAVESIADNRATTFPLRPGDVVFVPERRW